MSCLPISDATPLTPPLPRAAIGLFLHVQPDSFLLECLVQLSPNHEQGRAWAVNFLCMLQCLVQPAASILSHPKPRWLLRPGKACPRRIRAWQERRWTQSSPPATCARRSSNWLCLVLSRGPTSHRSIPFLTPCPRKLLKVTVGLTCPSSPAPGHLEIDRKAGHRKEALGRLHPQDPVLFPEEN